MPNAELVTTLDDAVEEMLALLTGLDLTYEPQLDRYQAVTRTLNRALRAIALEKEWSYFTDVESAGPAVAGETVMYLRSSVRPRMIGDDNVRLVDEHGHTVRFAFWLPRDAIWKYQNRGGLWCCVVRNELRFSRPFTLGEDGLDVQVPVMREPRMFRLPDQPEDPELPLVTVPTAIRNQPVDFQYPDLVIAKAAFMYAQTDPVMQPRVQTLEAQYKDLMYQIIERDDRNTDAPYMNDFFVPVENGIHHTYTGQHWHPHSDERR